MRVSERVAAQIVDVPFPHVMEDRFEAAMLILQERVSERIVVPQNLERRIEVMKVIRQEWVQEHIVAGPQIQELVVEVFKVNRQERVSERMACGPQSRIDCEDVDRRNLEVLDADPWPS